MYDCLCETIYLRAIFSHDSDEALLWQAYVKYVFCQTCDSVYVDWVKPKRKGLFPSQLVKLGVTWEQGSQCAPNSAGRTCQRIHRCKGAHRDESIAKEYGCESLTYQMPILAAYGTRYVGELFQYELLRYHI